MLRHADDITLNHLIELRKLQTEVEALQEENERLRWVLDTIVTNTDPNSTKHRDYDNLIKKIYMCARAALEETE